MEPQNNTMRLRTPDLMLKRADGVALHCFRNGELSARNE